jgi:uncharacterized membrane protein
MKNKQKVAGILSFISLILCIITIVFAFAVIDDYIDINPISAMALYPILLIAAFILSIIAISLNKKQILGWGILLLVLTFLSLSIYVALGARHLPLGAGTN